MRVLTLGSLFDGSGGFPLAGAMCGISPLWASEIEPYPIRVTKARFPHMEHLGSVLDVRGDEIKPVDIITFGSPCQDLSVAGRQMGIHGGTRSSLFFEAVRIAKEMRARDRAAGRTGVDIRPRFLVWENVPGAFSSNSGEDFRAVLEAIGGVAEDRVSIPLPEKGKWKHAGCVVGDGWSVAWRLYDAQYWGVPQRRKRIYLVADLASERAGEILFECEGLCGDPAEGGEAWERAADDAKGGVGGSTGVKCLNPWDVQSHRLFDVTGSYHTLYAAGSSGLHGICYDITGTYSNSMKSPTPDSCFRERTVGRTLDTFVGSPECNQGGMAVVHALDCRNFKDNEEVSGTLQAKPNGGHSLNFQNPVCYDTTQVTSPLNYSNPKPGDPCHPLAAQQHPPLCVGNGQLHQMSMVEQSNTLDCMHDQQAILTQGNHPRKYIIRRLTPLECCRLQGFPDWWENGVCGSDTARYKMWGNGIALPCAVDVLSRIANNGKE